MKTKQILLATLILAGIVSVIPLRAQNNSDKTPQKRDMTRLSESYYIPNRFTGKVILVTGGARGIGKYTALRAVKEGANVVIMDWLVEEGQKTVDSLNSLKGEGFGKALFVPGNISKDEDCLMMIEKGVTKFGKIDYAVLNAGVMDGTYSGSQFNYEKQKELLPNIVTKASDEYWDNVFLTNAAGTFKSLRAVLNQMLDQNNGGSVVLVGSIAGMTGLSGNPAYVASKHAVNGLTRNAAIDYAPYGIRINSVNMAATSTPMVDRAMEFVKAEQAAGVGFGMGRIKTESLMKYCDSKHRDSAPWEQASNILYLLSDEASALTGLVMATDGGWTDF